LRAVIIGLVAVLAAGCGGGEAAAEMSDELHFVRSGGFAGQHDELTIQPNGDVSLISRDGQEQFSLSDEELANLTGVLEDTGLGDIPSDSTSEQPVPDAFTYVVTYGETEVRTDDASVPAGLTDLLSELTNIVEGQRSQ